MGKRPKIRSREMVDQKIDFDIIFKFQEGVWDRIRKISELSSAKGAKVETISGNGEYDYQDGTFEEQINREEQATIDRLNAQTENTEIPNYIRREEIRLEHEQWRRDRAAARGPGTPSPTWFDPVDRTFDPLEGIENTAGSAPPSSSDP